MYSGLFVQLIIPVTILSVGITAGGFFILSKTSTIERADWLFSKFIRGRYSKPEEIKRIE